MSERQRTGRPATPGASPEGEEPTASEEFTRLAESLLDSTERSLARLGMSDVHAFLNATRQSGGE